MTKKSPPRIDLSSDAFVQCPYATYHSLQAAGGTGIDPVIGTAVGAYEDLMSLARDTATFSSSITLDGQGPRHMGVGSDPVQPDVEEILERAHPMVNALFTADPPVHTRHRKLLSKALSPGRVRALEPHVRSVAEDLAAGFLPKGELDLFRDFAVPLPVTVIADVLGVDRADLWTFKEWGDLMISGNLNVLDHAQRRQVAEAVVAFHEYFIPRIEARRKQPTDDLLSEMVNAREADEPPLSTEELLPIIDQVLLAGHETTTNLIGNGVHLLLERPELVARLRERPELVEPFVEEVLRWDPPIQCTFRRATRDAGIGGAQVAAGDMVVPLWAAAGYDPAVFPEPDRFDPERPNVRKHMGFGYGPHFCAGAELARLEARIAFETLLRECDAMQLDAEASDLQRLPSFATHGYGRLVLRFTPVPRLG